MRNILMVLGILMVLMGGLWTGQGLGLIMWPASSFMLAQGQWAIIGSVVVLAGLGLIWFARRKA
jgi:hypothetical protein